MHYSPLTDYVCTARRKEEFGLFSVLLNALHETNLTIFSSSFFVCAQATFDCLMKTYGFLTPDLWTPTRFVKSPFQEYTDFLGAKHLPKIATVDTSERLDA